MNVVRPRALLALIAAATVVSCGESTAPLPEPELDDALEAMTEVQESAGPAIAMLGGAAVPSAGDAGICPYNASNQRFVCPQVTASGLTLSRYYQLLDASGAPQSAWGTNVVSVRSVTDASGTLTTTPGSSMQLTQHDESTLSGLRSATRTLTGTGTATFTVTPTGGSPTVMNMTRTTDLTLPEPGPNTYPTGTMTMTTSFQGTSVTSTLTLTFNGTSTATLNTNFGGITQTCTMNLATHAAPVCS